MQWTTRRNFPTLVTGARRCWAISGLVVVLLSSPFILNSHAQGVITTVAGNGRVLRGDGGPATAAVLGEIWGVAVDSAGNVFAADVSNNQVVKISPTGILTVVAGNGLQGFSGDGGPATSASLNRPRGLAVDGSGNLYIADQGSNRVRKVSPSGIISTVAGSGVFGFTGDGGPATSASFGTPSGVAVDAAGNLYIADGNNHRIRKVSPTGIITTVAGDGVARFAGDGGPATAASLFQPWDVALDGSGNLYIADARNYRIRKVSPAGIISTVAGGSIGFSGDGGPATRASLNFPQGVAVDPTGQLYIADTNNGRIRKVSSDGTISTMAGVGLVNFSGDGGPATSASLSQPLSVAVDSAGNLYIADWFNHRIRKVSPTGIISTVAGTGVAGFSGDGGPAVSASLNEPQGVALDAAGNVYFADGADQRVRKISSLGVISTVAGNGRYAFSGDGGPATNASFRGPTRLAFDAAGNLFITDANNHRIRKVSPTGIISTVAGNGVEGFAGDGAPATSASLQDPRGVHVDAAGNLYIADFGNNRIRKVSSGGIITTVAGGGVSGDGGPATSAALAGPMDVALDTAGNLYIAEIYTGRIRKVNPSGTITTFAGRGGTGFSGDGGPATRALFDSPRGVAVDGAGNVYIADTFSDRIRKVLAAAPSFSIAPTNLVFAVRAGAPSGTAQRITVSSSVSGLQWSAQARTGTGGDWLTVSPASGSAPGTTTVNVNASALSPGTYTGAVTVQAPLAVPSTQTAAVQLTIEPALPAQLSVEPGSLTFEIPAGTSTPTEQTLRINNAGGGTLSWTARAGTTSGGNWLRISETSGSASAAAPATIQVIANVTGLAPGVYAGSVRVENPAANQSETAAVTLLVSGVTQTILVSQAGLLFTGVDGGAAVPSQSVGVLNTGQGAMDWRVETGTLSGGNWLSVSPTTGRSDAASIQIPQAAVAANVSGLRAGRYSGFIRIVSPRANNSPQLVSVDLNVLPPGSNPGVLVQPTGLIFAGLAGASSPGSQTVRVATAARSSLEFRGGLLTLDGGDWLEVAPRNAVLSATDPRTITVQPSLETLAPGVYRGALTLLFGDGSVQTVNILFLVVERAAGAAIGNSTASESAAALEAAQPCASQRLHAVHRSLGANFASPAGWPTTIEVQVADNCGNAVGNAAVVASFSNGDPPVALATLRNGLYVGTWRPVTSNAQTTVTVRASLPPLAPAEIQAQGQVSGNPTAPALNVGGVVNAASFARDAAVAPGAIVSVFGRNLARGANQASRLPLETILGGATLNVGGVDAPLFFTGDGQINAQLPFDLTPNSRPHVAVRIGRDGSRPETITVPETITIAPSQPGIFTMNQQGTGQGAIVDTRGRVVDSTAPARSGEAVQVFCTGLGVTQPRVRPGEPAPAAEPLARVVAAVEARIGGRPARVLFAGLAPGFVGLYQVNVEIPAGVEPGAGVPLVLVQNGVPSNTVTLAIQ